MTDTGICHSEITIISSIIRRIVISILLIAVVVASIELYSFHKLYKRAEDSIDGYVIERIHDETP